MTCEQILQAILTAILENKVKLSAIYEELDKLNKTIGGS